MIQASVVLVAFTGTHPPSDDFRRKAQYPLFSLICDLFIIVGALLHDAEAF
jgi:hypothetical protein